MHPKKIVKIVFCILLLQTMMPNFTSLNAQVQSHQSTVIDFLSRMAQKGKIEFNDMMGSMINLGDMGMDDDAFNDYA